MKKQKSSRLCHDVIFFLFAVSLRTPKYFFQGWKVNIVTSCSVQSAGGKAAPKHCTAVAMLGASKHNQPSQSLNTEEQGKESFLSEILPWLLKDTFNTVTWH